MERPRPKPRAVLAGRIVELMEFLEYRVKLLFGDAGAGVPNLYAQLVAAPPAAEQDLARARCISLRSRAGCGSSVRVGADRSERSAGMEPRAR